MKSCPNWVAFMFYLPPTFEGGEMNEEVVFFQWGPDNYRNRRTKCKNAKSCGITKMTDIVSPCHTVLGIIQNPVTTRKAPNRNENQPTLCWGALKIKGKLSRN